jgi:hypothetical protein
MTTVFDFQNVEDINSSFSFEFLDLIPDPVTPTDQPIETGEPMAPTAPGRTMTALSYDFPHSGRGSEHDRDTEDTSRPAKKTKHVPTTNTALNWHM